MENENKPVDEDLALVASPEDIAALDTPEAKAMLKGLSIRALMLRPDVFEQLEKLAAIMASGRCSIPAHLHGNQADCFAILMQSGQWGMNPWPVAQKTHLINGTLGYEAQLVNAVVVSSGVLEGRFNYEFFGDWNKILGKVKILYNDKKKPYTVPGWKTEDEEGLGIKTSATIKGEDKPKTLELLLKQATVRNSTLWAGDPKQQLAYLSVKRWARLHAPETIMGVYTPDELEESAPPPMKNVTPQGETQTEKLKSVLNQKEKEEAPTETPKEMELPVDEPAMASVNQDFFDRLRDALNETHITDPFFLQGLQIVWGYKAPNDIPEDKQEEIIKWVKLGCPDK